MPKTKNKTKGGTVITYRQVARQNTRKGGQYVKMNRCELCGKPAGDEHTEYYSDDRCNKYGPGLCLCSKCGDILYKLPDDQYLAAFEKKKKG